MSDNIVHNFDAERAVLGAVMTAPQVIDDLTDIITGSDFYHPRHETIWDAALAIHGRGDRPDAVLVAKQIGGNLERIGGATYLIDLTSVEVTPSPSQAPQYARMVAEAATARRLVDAGTKIRARAEAGGDIREMAEDARRIVDEATAEAGRQESGMGAAALVDETIDIIESDQEKGILTGWPDLDHYVNGLRGGQLVVIGARPSVGKSVIAANLAATACKAGIGVHFASLEMTRTEVMQRMFSATATVNLSRIISGELSDSDWGKVGSKTPEITNWPLWVDDQASQSLLQLRSRARSTARRLPLGMIVVDYLQLMAPRSRQAPREQQVGEISEGLKALAKEMRVPVIALAQVNRGPQDRQDKRPAMSDLRESGRIEADADHVWLLHRQDLVDPKSMTGELEVIVAKNRNGISGSTAHLAFQGHYSRATSMSRGSAPIGVSA